MPSKRTIRKGGSKHMRRKRRPIMTKQAIVNLSHEPKFTTQDVSPTSLSTSPAFTLLNGLSQGQSATTREGNRIFMTHLELRIQYVVADTTNTVRLMVVYDKQPNLAVFTASGSANALLDTPASAAIVYADYQTATRRRFKVLMDRTIGLDLVGSYQKTIHKRIKINKYAEYNANNGTVADITTGSLYILQISDSSAISHPTTTFFAKLYYKDV